MTKSRLKITIDEINERNVPYQLFLDSIKSKETLRKYKKSLQSFLKIIPVKLYKDHLGKVPRNKEPSTLANIFVKLSKKDPELAANIIATFIKNEKKVVVVL